MMRMKDLVTVLDDDRNALLRRLVNFVTQGNALFDVDETERLPFSRATIGVFQVSHSNRTSPCFHLLAVLRR